MTDAALDVRGLGDNRPPVREVLAERNEDLRAWLEEEGTDLTERRDELLAATERAPTEIADEEWCHKVEDLIKMIATCAKTAEARRVADKEPVLQAGRLIDGFYKSVGEWPFKSSPLAKADKTLRGPLNVYLRKKADAERRAREEAERKAREEAERAAREVAARVKALKDEKDLEAAIAAEETAKQAAADALKAQKAAEVNAAELSRTRSDHGAVASLRTFWDFKTEGDAAFRAGLDLEALRSHLSMDALEKAVKSFIRAGGRELCGVVIFENTSTVVR